MAGPIVGIAGTVLAVMLSFMVVAVWQEYDVAANNVQIEASAITDLDHVAVAFPQPQREKVRALIRQYADDVVRDEWPLMRVGKRSVNAHLLAQSIQQTILAYTPKSVSQQQLEMQASALTQGFIDARRQRLFSNDQGIPPIMWACMLFVGAVTVGFIYLFRVESFTVHTLMTVGTAAIIGAIFVLIAEMDYPFRGASALRPTAFLQVRATIDDVNSTSGFY
ncbi:MAG TPA: DUF4239 domain-containing protein [Candidatus Baltobacteraceae bacterium]